MLRPDKFESLSYSTLRSIFLDKLSVLGLGPTVYGLHSLRSGGASVSANRKTLDNR